MGKMSKDRKEAKMSCVSLPLIVEPWQEMRIERRLKLVANIYNAMKDYEWDKIEKIRESSEWKNELSDAILKQYHDELDEINKEKKLSQEQKERVIAIKEEMKRVYNRRNDIYFENNINKFGFIADLKQFYLPYNNVIPQKLAVQTIATPLWMAFQKCLFGNGNIPKYRKYKFTNTLMTDGKSGMRLLNESGRYYVVLSNQRYNAKPIKLPVKISDNPYDLDMINRDIKQIKLVRKQIKTGYQYYVMLTVVGSPFNKNDRVIGDGIIGMHIYRNKVSVVSNKEAFEFDLAPGVDAYRKELEELSRRQNALRQMLNPQNYNEDGTIKNGIYNPETKKLERLKWNTSRKYMQISRERRELQRVYMQQREIYINSMVNKILTMGDKILIADLSFAPERKKKSGDSTIAELVKQKNKRKDIQDGAPAAFLIKLNAKLNYANKEPIDRIRISKDNWWYCHMIDGSDSSYFKDNYIEMPNGIKYPQGLYRALLIKHYDSDNEAYDHEAIADELATLLSQYGDR